MSAPYLARIETGSREPTLRTLEAIANVLSVPVHQLFGTDTLDVVPLELQVAIAGLGAEDIKLLAMLASRLQGETKRVAVKKKSAR